MLELIEDASIDRLKALALFYGPSAGRSSTGKGGKEEPMPLAQLRAQLEGMKLVRFRGKMLIIGLGSIGMGIIPLLVRHFEFGQGNDGALPIRVLTGEDRRECAETIKDKFGISYTLQCLTPSNYGDVLGSFGLTSGDLIVNLSVDVSSRDVVLWSQARGVLYVDTVTEPWPGTYDNAELPISARTNYSLREEILALKKTFGEGSPTCVVTHGANPGMVSHLVKQALLNVRARLWPDQANAPAPSCRRGWAELARSLGAQALHVAERDTQQAPSVTHRTSAFYNTWSVDGFLSEGCQPCELGWGTHERADLPTRGRRHAGGCGAAVYLERPGSGTRVLSWTPRGGPHVGFLITHAEVISIADYFTLRDDSTGEILYRPTVLYAYRPCDLAVLALDELRARGFDSGFLDTRRVLVDEIESGSDDLGVLVMGSAALASPSSTEQHYAHWYGSELDVRRARALVDHNTATTLQVTAAVLAAAVFVARNPSKGILEPDELPFDEILEVMCPYVAPLRAAFTDWTPLGSRGGEEGVGRGAQLLFPPGEQDREQHEEKGGPCGPWLFQNFLVE